MRVRTRWISARSASESPGRTRAPGEAPRNAGQAPDPQDRTGTHERLALPEGRLLREVPVERAQRVRERRRLAALAEPQVHPERLARARDRRGVEAVDDAIEVDVGIGAGVGWPS